MTISEMSNEQLLRNYAALLKEIEHDYQIKKEFETEIKNRDFKEDDNV